MAMYGHFFLIFQSNLSKQTTNLHRMTMENKTDVIHLPNQHTLNPLYMLGFFPNTKALMANFELNSFILN